MLKIKNISLIFSFIFRKNKNQQVQLIIDKPYIIGTDEYESFIYINFFEELINKGVCFKKFISINIY